jgi:hypothetical protein
MTQLICELTAEKIARLQADNLDLINENHDLKTALASYKKAIKALTNDEDEDEEDETDGDRSDDTSSHLASPSKQPTNVRSQPPERDPIISRPRKSGGAKARAVNVFHAVQLWNQNNPQQAVFVNQALLNQEFNISRPTVVNFLEEFQQQVLQENAKLGDTPRSRNKPENVEALKQFVEQQIDRMSTL